MKTTHYMPKMNLLACALSCDGCSRMCNCSTAKEFWNILEVTHEGKNEVEDSKINLPTDNMNYLANVNLGHTP